MKLRQTFGKKEKLLIRKKKKSSKKTGQDDEQLAITYQLIKEFANLLKDHIQGKNFAAQIKDQIQILKKSFVHIEGQSSNKEKLYELENLFRSETYSLVEYLYSK